LIEAASVREPSRQRWPVCTQSHGGI